MKKLDGQVCIITGAGSGLGAAIARRLATEGVRCVLAGRQVVPLQTLGAEIEAVGGAARVVVTDVQDEAQIERLVAETVLAFGGVDILINNAGVFREASITETATAVWDETLGTNLRGAFLLCRAVWPHLMRRGGGQIINLSSVSSVQGYENETAYCASKFGLNGLTEALALEGASHNIRVLAVCPGAVDTPIWDGSASPDVRSRMMRPEAVADLVSWLVCSPRNIRFSPVVVRNLKDPWEA
jgi:3-oxoacyl-[acyl-carrier protein] reductase